MPQYDKIYFLEALKRKIANRISKIELEIENLENELKETEIDTIYIGGGTPNSLSLNQLEALFEAINNKNFQNVIEYTIETNYELVTIDQIKLFKKYNINRVSIGVQTFVKEAADEINRYCNFQIFVRIDFKAFKQLR